jgi:hypothetical protein
VNVRTYSMLKPPQSNYSFPLPLYSSTSSSSRYHQ